MTDAISAQQPSSAYNPSKISGANADGNLEGSNDAASDLLYQKLSGIRQYIDPERVQESAQPENDEKFQQFAKAAGDFLALYEDSSKEIEALRAKLDAKNGGKELTPDERMAAIKAAKELVNPLRARILAILQETQKLQGDMSVKSSLDDVKTMVNRLQIADKKYESQMEQAKMNFVADVVKGATELASGVTSTVLGARMAKTSADATKSASDTAQTEANATVNRLQTYSTAMQQVMAGLGDIGSGYAHLKAAEEQGIQTLLDALMQQESTLSRSFQEQASSMQNSYSKISDQLRDAASGGSDLSQRIWS